MSPRRGLVRGLGWLARWAAASWRWLGVWVIAAGAVWWVTRSVTFAVALGGFGLVPGLVGAVWVGVAPACFDRLVASPWRRWRWRRLFTGHWPAVCRDVQWTERRTSVRRRSDGSTVTVERWLLPRLGAVRTSGHAVTLAVRARPGQTVAELEAGVERLASIADAAAFRAWPLPGSASLAIELVMRDLLAEPVTATSGAAEPRATLGQLAGQGGGLVVDRVLLGRTQAGRDWELPLRGRHTLCVGASGSGKGSVLWGVCCALAPAVRADVARLWGVDLKAGVELTMGRGLFCTVATTPADAVEVLGRLATVCDARGRAMAGQTRLHQPAPGDPLHVLVIDELAALTAYAPTDIRKEADRLLSLILTQGRALGVVVVGFVQDPRKEVVGMRGLFTQTIALRLRSADETRMVLGEGMARLAPAHLINRAAPGTGWVVDDTGTTDRVRADYWPDPVIRDLAARYATTTETAIEPPTTVSAGSATRGARSPRRTPRQQHRTEDRTEDAAGTGPEAAA